MKILITGVLGFIGAHLYEIAEREGFTVVGLDALRYSARRKNLPDGALWRVSDICDARHIGYMLRLHKPDAVIHLAAETHVARSIESREEFLRTNVIGTDVLLSECLKYWETDAPRWFRAIHVSTDEVYGSLDSNAPPWTEDSPYAPNNPYSASKAASDHLARAYWRTYALPVIVTHCGNNYGSRQHPEKLIPTVIRQILTNEPITLHGDGTHTRDWIHVSDHCTGLLSAVAEGAPGETYNFSAESEKSNLQIVRIVCDAMQQPQHPIKYVTDRPGNDKRYAMVAGKAYRKLGWNAKLKVTDDIASTVQWYVNNPNYGDDYEPA